MYTFDTIVYGVVFYGVLALAVWAFVDALARLAASYMAAGKLTKPGWMAITGIAGPDGGSAKKPVGTVIFARAVRGANPAAVHAEQRDFGEIGRAGVRAQAALVALDLLMPDAEAGA